MDKLGRKKYKHVKNFLSLDIVDFLSTWSIQNFKITPDPQAPMSFSVHSDDSQIYSHVLQYLKPVMEKETGLNLKPTYSYNRVYVGGSSLKKHKDRGDCEISASISLKHYYKNKDYKWPLCMEDKPIVIEEGDGVIYKGCEIEHWRPVFDQPQNCWHHQLFIHYLIKNN